MENEDLLYKLLHDYNHNPDSFDSQVESLRNYNNINTKSGFRDFLIDSMPLKGDGSLSNMRNASHATARGGFTGGQAKDYSGQDPASILYQLLTEDGSF